MAFAAFHSLAHAELFATVIPGFPVWAEAGPVGSRLWPGWMALIGVFLPRDGVTRGPASRAGALGAGRGSVASVAVPAMRPPAYRSLP